MIEENKSYQAMYEFTQLTSIPIKLINHGVASVINKKIYINKKLLSYPHLLSDILKHEYKHINGAHGLAFELSEKNPPRLIQFMIKNPSTWTQLLPMWFYNNQLIIEKSVLKIWIFLAIIIFLGGVAIYGLL